MALAPGQFTALHRIADRQVPPTARAFREAMNGWREALSETEAVAIATDPSLAVLVDNSGAAWAREQLRPSLLGVFMGGMRSAARTLSLPNSVVRVRKAEGLPDAELERLGVDAAQLEGLSGGVAVLDFSAPTPWAETWAEARAASMVTAIDETTRLAIREIVARAVRDGGHPRDTARYIRDIIGLDRRQANAYYNMLRRLQEQGVSERVLNQRLEAYRKRALRERSLRIARTETLNATNAGVTRGWDEFAAEGIIDQSRSVKVWIITYDELTCPICRPLDGSTQPLDGVWGLGGIGSVRHPPAHPYCRCTVGLLSTETAAGRPTASAATLF